MKKFKRIYVEITNICNLNCSFCPKHSRAKGTMTAQQFEHIANQVAPMTDAFCLHLMGEPLLHPELGKILQICHDHNTKVLLTTNGTLLHKNLPLLTSGNIKRLSVSLHSYEANQHLLSLDTYLTNVLTSAQAVAQSGTYVELRLWNATANDIAQNSLNKQILDYIAAFFKTELDTTTTKRIDVAPHIYIGFDDAFLWPTHTQDGSKDSSKFCYGLRTHFGILCDGTVVACCLDNEGQLALGNVFESDIQSILTSQRAQNIACGFSNHTAVEPLCQSCQFATKFN